MKSNCYQPIKPAFSIAVPDITEGWCHVEFKGRSDRWCRAEMRSCFGVKMIHCEQPFQWRGTRFEFFNADAIFRVTLHTEDRVRHELKKLESRWAAKEEDSE